MMEQIIQDFGKELSTQLAKQRELIREDLDGIIKANKRLNRPKKTAIEDPAQKEQDELIKKYDELPKNTRKEIRSRYIPDKMIGALSNEEKAYVMRQYENENENEDDDITEDGGAEQSSDNTAKPEPEVIAAPASQPASQPVELPPASQVMNIKDEDFQEFMKEYLAAKAAKAAMDAQPTTSNKRSAAAADLTDANPSKKSIKCAVIKPINELLTPNVVQWNKIGK